MKVRLYAGNGVLTPMGHEVHERLEQSLRQWFIQNSHQNMDIGELELLAHQTLGMAAQHALNRVSHLEQTNGKEIG